MMFHGIGAYPTDSYYDPSRASWLPFWIDTPTESAQKYGMYGGANINTVYPNPPAPVPPVPQPDLTGQTFDIDQQLVDTAAANRGQTQQFFSDVASTLPNSPTSKSGVNGVMLLYVAIGVVTFMALKK